jgi:hypothetical protein
MKAYGGVDVYTHVFMTSALVRGEWSVSRRGDIYVYYNMFCPLSSNTFVHSPFDSSAISPYTGQCITYGRGCIVLLSNDPIYIVQIGEPG